MRSATPCCPDPLHQFSYPLPLDCDVIVIGAGGHAKVILSILLQAGARILGIYDDNPAKRGTKTLQVPVLGSIAELNGPLVSRCVVGMGDNATRQQVAARFPSADYLTVVHPRAHVHPLARLGSGSMVIAGAVVGPGACIGRHCIINTGAVVEADCVVGDFCHVGPGSILGKGAKLGDGVFMGIASTVTHRTTVGAWTIIGAGAVVTTHIGPRVVAVGAPAIVRRMAVDETATR